MEIRTALLSVLLLLGWSAPALAQAGPACSPSDEAGWVARVEYSAPPTNAPLPRILRGRLALNVSEGAPLCVHDLVRNPLGSVRRVWLRLAGEELRSVEPGQDYVVPRPGILAAIGEWFRPFRAYSLWNRRNENQIQNAHVRGDNCRYRPVEAERVAKVVPSWGPIYLPWACAEGETGPWQVTILSGSEHASMTAYTNLVQIDPSMCPRTCLVDVTPVVGTHASSLMMQIMVVNASSLHLPSGNFGDHPDAAHRALIGAELIGGRGGRDWQLQGMSLLWGAGCELPAAGQAASRLYGTGSAEDVCANRQ